MSHEREEIIRLINVAKDAGARQSAACEIIGISAKPFSGGIGLRMSVTTAWIPSASLQTS